MQIQESAEDYLEAIHYLGLNQEHVRSIDVVHHLEISKPSVSVYLKNLKNNGYINVDEKGYLTLTEKGEELTVQSFLAIFICFCISYCSCFSRSFLQNKIMLAIPSVSIVGSCNKASFINPMVDTFNKTF